MKTTTAKPVRAIPIKLDYDEKVGLFQLIEPYGRTSSNLSDWIESGDYFDIDELPEIMSGITNSEDDPSVEYTFDGCTEAAAEHLRGLKASELDLR